MCLVLNPTKKRAAASFVESLDACPDIGLWQQCACHFPSTTFPRRYLTSLQQLMYRTDAVYQNRYAASICSDTYPAMRRPIIHLHYVCDRKTRKNRSCIKLEHSSRPSCRQILLFAWHQRGQLLRIAGRKALNLIPNAEMHRGDHDCEF